MTSITGETTEEPRAALVLREAWEIDAARSTLLSFIHGLSNKILPAAAKPGLFAMLSVEADYLASFGGFGLSASDLPKQDDGELKLVIGEGNQPYLTYGDGGSQDLGMRPFTWLGIVGVDGPQGAGVPVVLEWGLAPADEATRTSGCEALGAAEVVEHRWNSALPSKFRTRD